MSARDIIVTVVVLFAITIVSVFTYLIFSTFYTQLKAEPTVAAVPEAVSAIEGAENNFLPANDYIPFVMFMAFFFMIIITSWMVGAQPVFMFFYILLGSFAVYLSMALSNAWEQMFTDPTLLAILSEFPLTNNIMTYLPFYISGVLAMGIFVMFGKPFMSRTK
jgi:ABC-type uncharacterized transport system fused permease/ATPase subunit